MGKNEDEGSSSKRRKISRSEDDAQLFQDLLAKANQYPEELEKFAEEVMNAATPETDIAGPIMSKNKQLMDQFSEWIKEIVKPQNRDATEGSELTTIQMLIEDLNNYLQDCKSIEEEPEWIECVLDSMITRLKDLLNR